MKEKKQEFVEDAQALGEEGLDQVVGAISDGGGTNGPDKDLFKNMGKDFQNFFESLGKGLQGEGVHSRESTEKIRDVLKGKAKW